MLNNPQETSASANLPTLAQIRTITDIYAANSLLEADGMTNVLHFYLTHSSIAHRVMSGMVSNIQTATGMPWHFWMEVVTQEGTATVDYCARMWLGNHESVPHGVFLQAEFPSTRYEGQEFAPDLLPESVIRSLLEPITIPTEWNK